MVLLALLVVPAVWLRVDMAPWMIVLVDLPIFTLSSLSVAAFYWTARREATGSSKNILRWIPPLMMVGIGLSINNARAVIEALLGRQSSFRRTPKYNLELSETLAHRRYRISINCDTWIEAGFAAYFGVATGAAISAGLWGAIPFLLLFEFGFAYTSIATLVQAFDVTLKRQRA